MDYAYSTQKLNWMFSKEDLSCGWLTHSRP